jgi:hypothetical protein
MSIEYMRHKVSEAYAGDSWKKRVSRMPDTQVEAIYDRLLESGKIEPRYLRSVRIYRAGTAHGREVLKIHIDECHDETAYVSGKDRSRTDGIPGQIEFGDL